MDSDPGFNPQNLQVQQMQMNNQGFNSASALQIRLDTQSIKANLAPYFRGVDVGQVMGDDGKPRTMVLWQGSPLCNDAGYQAIMTWLEIINPQTIQGNMETAEDLGNYMADFYMDIVEDFMTNRITYEMPTRQVSKVAHLLVDIAYPVFTRTLYNKEREGMNNTVKVQETTQSQPARSGMFNIPFFGGRKN